MNNEIIIRIYQTSSHLIRKILRDDGKKEQIMASEARLSCL